MRNVVFNHLPGIQQVYPSYPAHQPAPAPAGWGGDSVSLSSKAMQALPAQPKPGMTGQQMRKIHQSLLEQHGEDVQAYARQSHPEVFNEINWSSSTEHQAFQLLQALNRRGTLTTDFGLA